MLLFSQRLDSIRNLHSFPTRRSSDLRWLALRHAGIRLQDDRRRLSCSRIPRSEEHTSELQSRRDLVCRLLLEKKKKEQNSTRLNSSHLERSHAVFSSKHNNKHVHHYT